MKNEMHYIEKDDMYVSRTFFVVKKLPAGFFKQFVYFYSCFCFFCLQVALLLFSIKLIQRFTIPVLPFNPTVCTTTQNKHSGRAWRGK